MGGDSDDGEGGESDLIAAGEKKLDVDFLVGTEGLIVILQCVLAPELLTIRCFYRQAHPPLLRPPYLS